jgi:hypothetical protein
LKLREMLGMFKFHELRLREALQDLNPSLIILLIELIKELLVVLSINSLADMGLKFGFTGLII